MPISSGTLSLLRWRSRRGLLENDLMMERFFERHHATIEELDLEPLNQILDLSDNDLMDLLLRRKEPEGELANDEVRRVLAMLRTPGLPAIQK
jgi:antitoxin CptB